MYKNFPIATNQDKESPSALQATVDVKDKRIKPSEYMVCELDSKSQYKRLLLIDMI